MDWLGVALNLTGTYLLPTRYRWAIGLFIVGNFVWIAYALPEGIWSIVGLQVVFFVLNVRAWKKGPGEVSGAPGMPGMDTPS